MAWAYILECSDGSFYVGSTTDLERRLWQHQNGEGATYTQRRRPVRLVWSMPFDRIDEAFAFEKRLQGWGRSKRLALIEGRVDELPLLASRSYEALERRESPAPRSRDGRGAPSSTSGDGRGGSDPATNEGRDGGPSVS